MSNLGPQFYPKEGLVEINQNVRKDATLYHGTAGDIEEGVVRPDIGALGDGAYATEKLNVAKEYASNSARMQGRLFGTVYEVTPVSDKAVHVGSEAGGGIVLDPEGMRADKVVDFPTAIRPHQYRRALERADEVRSRGWSHIDMPRSFHD